MVNQGLIMRRTRRTRIPTSPKHEVYRSDKLAKYRHQMSVARHHLKRPNKHFRAVVNALVQLAALGWKFETPPPPAHASKSRHVIDPFKGVERPRLQMDDVWDMETMSKKWDRHMNYWDLELKKLEDDFENDNENKITIDVWGKEYMRASTRRDMASECLKAAMKEKVNKEKDKEEENADEIMGEEN